MTNHALRTSGWWSRALDRATDPYVTCATRSCTHNVTGEATYSVIGYTTTHDPTNDAFRGPVRAAPDLTTRITTLNATHALREAA